MRWGTHEGEATCTSSMPFLSSCLSALQTCGRVLAQAEQQRELGTGPSPYGTASKIHVQMFKGAQNEK